MTDREAFEEWYDAQPDGRIQPWDVWQAATAAKEAEIAAIKAEQDASPATQKTFESWAGKRERYHTTREWDAMHRAWQAATAAERERCAKVCDAIAYEWRGANSQSVQCANAIRKGE